VTTPRAQLKPIRVLLIDLQPLLADLVGEALSGRTDMMLVGGKTGAVLSDVRSLSANVVVTAMPGGALPRALAHLVDTTPRIAVIGVDARDARTFVELRDVSLDGLLEITRAAAGVAMNS